jgi:Protein of unknown function (DUF3562)
MNEMPSPYRDRDEEALQQGAIEEIAQALSQPIGAVKPVYDGEYARLKADARVTDYLALLAARRARETLLRKAL